MRELGEEGKKVGGKKGRGRKEGIRGKEDGRKGREWKEKGKEREGKGKKVNWR